MGQGRAVRALYRLGDIGGDLRRFILLPRVVGCVLGDVAVALPDAGEVEHDLLGASERDLVDVVGVGAVLTQGRLTAHHGLGRLFECVVG